MSRHLTQDLEEAYRRLLALSAQVEEMINLAVKALMERDHQEKEWVLRGLLARPDGSKVLRIRQTVPRDSISVKEAQELGQKCALELLQEAGSGFYQ